MIVKNPKKQTMEEIRKEYDGYCVCIADRETNERDWTLAGKVIIYDKWMDDVWEQAKTLSETGDIFNEDWEFTNLAGFGDFIGSGILHVISFEDDFNKEVII